ncbi:hypothetical protein M404DRAFT_395444 [Pisolithus tinctorius Marx 270]|uniref:Uncharacterized protein n=1 Tax=Pisolithus tinctorius Marx 270 TaxID=870435 RepID=A0A0C3P3Z7_PISTI|nr:hypothetical protein M404DRAFT_395444 [Pisolithus tinctorius Marx 270]
MHSYHGSCDFLRIVGSPSPTSSFCGICGQTDRARCKSDKPEPTPFPRRVRLGFRIMGLPGLPTRPSL